MHKLPGYDGPCAAKPMRSSQPNNAQGDPSRQPAVAAAIDQLHVAMDSLDSELGRLAERLAPVLSDAPPELAGAEKREQTCAVANNLQALAERAGDMRGAVLSLLSRLEV